MAEKFDVVVIGSGPGGYVAAIKCAQKGASTAIIEKDLIGGICLNYGCIPSKALLASAHTLLMAKSAEQMGIDIPQAKPNRPKIQQRKDQIVENLRKGLTSLLKTSKVKILQGRAIATAPNKVKVETETGQLDIETQKIILATGSEAIELPNIPFDGRTVITSKEALELPDVPESMLIVGGGAIGCELACIYAAVGTKVTIVEALSRLIPMEDQWVGRLLEREFKKLDIDVLTEQKVTSVNKTNGRAKATLENGQTIEAEKILIAVGRRPVCDKRTIDALGLQTKGPVIAVNEKMQTNVPGVYAVGDVVGTTYLAHGAFAEAQVAAINATGGDEKMYDYSLVPRAVYTFPEVASVGKSEDKCKAEGLDISVGRSFFRANGRSVAHNETVGEVRVIRDNSTNRVIGVTIVGAGATELIAAARLLLSSTEKISQITFTHPTVSETLTEAAQNTFTPH